MIITIITSFNSTNINFLGFPELVFFKENNRQRKKEQENYHCGAGSVFGPGEQNPLLYDNHDHEKPCEAKRNIEKIVEHFELIRLRYDLHVADCSEKNERYSGRKPADEENQSLRIVSVEGVVELSYDGSTQPDVALEEPQNGAASLREVLD
ncbi:hypothetical protein PanWU01x14_286830 [Parasponia andersonii]|uniref:Uncharacterized protein n=1 Tax=Parasponia andersonii TaxID=3476 RepID=A0A2P5AZ22_PARAD|nr:hypothetical protein PanWU01x14_286830 [Parasponia andersonii]